MDRVLRNRTFAMLDDWFESGDVTATVDAELAETGFAEDLEARSGLTLADLGTAEKLSVLLVVYGGFETELSQKDGIPITAAFLPYGLTGHCEEWIAETRAEIARQRAAIADDDEILRRAAIGGGVANFLDPDPGF